MATDSHTSYGTIELNFDDRKRSEQNQSIMERNVNDKNLEDKSIRLSMLIDSRSPKPSTSSSSSSSPEPITLKKELSLLNCICMIIGIIVGSGIFVSPRGVLQEAGSIGYSLIIWVLCGILSTIGALCYAELGTSIPESGGDYAYIRKACGPLPAFLYIWVSILIIHPAGNAISAMTFAYYILQSIYPDEIPAPFLVRMISACVIIILISINCYNVKWSTRLQDLFTMAKIVALILIVVYGIKQFFDDVNDIKSNNLSYPKSFENSNPSPGHVALAFYSGLFSYAGWNYLNFVVEELKDPFKNLPRAIYISLPFVTLIYLAVNLSYFTVLSKEEILNSNAVAVTFGNRVLINFAWIMPLSVAFSTFGGLNGGIFASSRLFFVGARNGHLPKSLAMIHTRYFTPIPSLIFLGLLSLLYLTTTQLYVLINYSTFIESSSVLISIGSLLWLRYTKPNHPRPIKVNIVFPIIFFLICLFLVILPFYVNPIETIIGITITLSGIPIYFLTVNWHSKPDLYNRFIDLLTATVQKV
ncbi:Large neutral amino acids transporter small subunit 2 [Sarcoptes scabiei]|uniref:Large neutral amino acids transporter small subunit 2 n=1 Tax=Sarcoptes scabiei TaxID=52283 RepID=A0A834R885_SARSC|nr:Large neutral amino acids transporter small subunit 2 [Sarcoptes scabiei]